MKGMGDSKMTRSLLSIRWRLQAGMAGLLLLMLFSTVGYSRAEDGSGWDAHAERQRLIHAYETSGGQAVEALRQALDHESGYVRRTAAQLLVRLGEAARSVIEAGLWHHDFKVRTIFIDGASELGMQQSLYALMEKDPHPAIRRELKIRYLLPLQLRLEADPFDPEVLERNRRYMDSRPILALDGQSGFIQAEGEVSPAADGITYAIWFYIRGSKDQRQALMGTGRGDGVGRPGINLFYHQDGHLAFYVANEEHVLRLTYPIDPVGHWIHAAASIDPSGRATLMINGVVVEQRYAMDFGRGGLMSGGIFRVGRRPYTELWYLDGMLGEVSVWSGERSIEEVRASMYTAPDDNDQALILRWDMTGEDGSPLYDHSGNGHVGSVRGTTRRTGRGAR